MQSLEHQDRFPSEDASWGSYDGVDFDDPEVRDRLRRFYSTDEANRYFWCAGHREGLAWVALQRWRAANGA